MRLNNEPINGFRQERLSLLIGGLIAQMVMRNMPKTETQTQNAKIELLDALDTGRHLEEAFELLNDPSACHVPEDPSLHFVATKNALQPSVPRAVETPVALVEFFLHFFGG